MEQATLIDIPSKQDVRTVVAPCPKGVEPGVVPFVWPAAVRRIWRRPKMLPPSVWAEKYRVMEDERPRPGPWNNDFARYGCGIMDVFFFAWLRLVVIVGPAQTIKTEMLLNCVGAAIAQAPGPVLMVYDQQDVAKTMSTTRVKKMIELSPALQGKITGRADDMGNYSIRLDNVRIDFAWATSVSALANRSYQYVFADEVDKYETTSKMEAGPVARLKLRTRAYKYTSKTVLASSPTTDEGAVSIELSRVQAVFEYAVVCPYCGVAHVMQFSGPEVQGIRTGVVWPDGEDDGERVKAQHLARYVCPHCLCKGSAPWDDYARDMAVRGGYWQERTTGLEIMAYMREYRPRSVGFQYSAMISPLVSLSETAGEFIQAKKDLRGGRIDAYKNWLNGYMGETWKEDFSPRKADAILALRDDRPRGVLPSVRKVAGLFALVDTQDDGFWYEIRAFGYGLECESWQVREGFVEDYVLPEGQHIPDGVNVAAIRFKLLDDVLWISYFDADGREMSVSHAFIDSQGHRASEVYEWCLLDRGQRVPLKGEDKMKQNYRMSPQEFWPGTTDRIEGGMNLLLVHTKYYKDWLHRKLQTAPADPGAYHMHSECSEAWAEMLCAEYVDARQKWVCPKGKPNHGWDVSVYGLAAVDFLGLRYLQPDEGEEEDTEEAPARIPRRNSLGWRA